MNLFCYADTFCCWISQATGLLAASGALTKVVGLDPSQGMIEAAQTALKSDVMPLLGENATDREIAHLKNCSVTYLQGSSENLAQFEANTFDLVTAGRWQFGPSRGLVAVSLSEKHAYLSHYRRKVKRHTGLTMKKYTTNWLGS